MCFLVGLVWFCLCLFAALTGPSSDKTFESTNDSLSEFAKTATVVTISAATVQKKNGCQLLSHHVAVVMVSYCHIILLWSGVGQLLSHHIAVVRGWGSAIVTSCCCGGFSYCHIVLLWSEVGGQLLLLHVAVIRQLLLHHVAVVRGWWSAIDTFVRRTLSRSFREKVN